MAYQAPTPTFNGTADVPEPTEEYQKNLKAYIEDIPKLGAAGTKPGMPIPNLAGTYWEGPEIKSGTPSVPDVTSEKLKSLKEAQTKFVTDAKFKKYTGWDHESLLNTWLSKGTTTCNEFVGTCVTKMGYKGGVTIGRFDVADQLVNMGLGHCWVPADSGAMPEFGDVYRLFEAKPDHNKMATNHMAVSLFFKGTDWYTVESGQGGKGTGHDLLRRKVKPWKPSSLQGWVSMKALLNSAKPVPFWLGGWWKVQDGDLTYWYYFGAGGKVSYTRDEPKSILFPPTYAPLIGTFVTKGYFDVEISWQSGDVDEKLQTTKQDSKNRVYTLKGMSPSVAKLTAQRLMTKYADH